MVVSNPFEERGRSSMDNTEYKQKLNTDDQPLSEEVLEAFSSFLLSCRNHPDMQAEMTESDRTETQAMA